MGIVAGVSGFLAEQDCNIIESSQFGDVISEQFFMRAVFSPGHVTPALEHLTAAFSAIGKLNALIRSL